MTARSWLPFNAGDGPVITANVLGEVYDERGRQQAKCGEQNHPDGTGQEFLVERAVVDRHVCQSAFAAGEGTYRDLLQEEVSEAFAEQDPALLRAELVQVAAVAVAWIEKIDRDIAKEKS